MFRHLLLATAVSCLLLACGKQDGPQLPSGAGSASVQAPTGTNATPAGTSATQPAAAGQGDASCPADGAGGECCCKSEKPGCQCGHCQGVVPICHCKHEKKTGN